jgi:hypothetical protein
MGIHFWTVQLSTKYLESLGSVDGDHAFYVRFSSLGAGFPGSGYTGLKLLSGGK